MGEPSLAAVGRDVEVYRFLHLPTWGRPVAVRIETRGSTRTTLVARRLSGSGGYAPGTVEASATLTLSDAAWRDLRARVDTAGFFGLPTSDTAGQDGEQWIVEGVRGGTYHLVDRWMPRQDPVLGRFIALCESMGGLAGPVWTQRNATGNRASSGATTGDAGRGR
jgi:hypothetical protein